MLRAEIPERQAQRDLQRSRGGQPRAMRDSAADLETRAHEREAGAGELCDGPACERAPPGSVLGIEKRELVALAKVSRVGTDTTLAGRAGELGLGAHRDAFGDCERQRQPLVVVGVLPDQVHATGCERAAALSRHWRSPRAAARPTPPAACPR